MESSWSGPWSETDFRNFIALMEGYGRALACRRRERKIPPAATESEVALGWEIRRKHPVYLSLLQRPSFLILLKKFEREVARQKEGLIREPDAVFAFIEYIAMYATGLFRAKFDEHLLELLAWGPTKARRKAAIRHIDELERLNGEGAFYGTKDFDLMAATVARLSRVRNNLAANTARKPRLGRKEFASQVIFTFARNLAIDFEIFNESILEDFAELMDVGCSHKTAERIMKKVRADPLTSHSRN